ncbi:MAG: nitrate/nitrite transporter NrtS, partial [Candidatus Rokuibacteriota bacterium]
MLGRSLRVALVVGVVLTVINQGDTLLLGSWTAALLWKVPLTFMVPFCVATWGALSSCSVRHAKTER